ncbi:hypothetical protein KJ765_00620 [Candidatus Micrarchaeota archaeon]|nr:hypothetical protein [Candidatus Micrarchaeota archaeon]
MENLEELSAVNSELRFLTLELMKIAVEQNKSFDQVLSEYFVNAHKLKRRLLWNAAPKLYRIRKPRVRLKP